jgi:tetratricopeptide (TPR) repeat protein
MAPAARVERVFGRTLAALGSEARALLEILAVAGDAVPMMAALDLAKADPSGIAAQELSAAKLATVEHHADGEWLVLRRPAVRTLLTDQLSADRQRAVHGAIAAALADDDADPWRQSRAAWHAAQAATAEAAPGALAALGEELLSQGQSEAALDLFERAARMPGVGAAIGARVAALRGAALLATSRRAEARSALEGARKQALRLHDAALEGQIVFHLAAAWQAEGDERRANALCDEALGLLEESDQRLLLARALLLSGETHHVAGRPEAARAALERGRALAAAMGEEAVLCAIDSALGALEADDGKIEAALRAWTAEVELLRAGAPGPRLVRALLRLADAHRRSGRLDLAVDAFDEAEETARLARHPFLRAEIGVERARLSRDLSDGNAADAQLARAAVALDPDASTPLRLAYRRAQVEARLDRGDRPAALAICQLGESEAGKAGALSLHGWFLGMAGVLTADPTALSNAMDVLTVSGDRRLLARLLLAGAQAGGDPELQGAAEDQARAAADPLLMLAALRARGDAEAQAEARTLVRQLLPFVPPALQNAFLRAPAVVWSGLSTALGL